MLATGSIAIAAATGAAAAVDRTPQLVSPTDGQSVPFGKPVFFAWSGPADEAVITTASDELLLRARRVDPEDYEKYGIPDRYGLEYTVATDLPVGTYRWRMYYATDTGAPALTPHRTFRVVAPTLGRVKVRLTSRESSVRSRPGTTRIGITATPYAKVVVTVAHRGRRVLRRTVYTAEGTTASVLYRWACNRPGTTRVTVVASDRYGKTDTIDRSFHATSCSRFEPHPGSNSGSDGSGDGGARSCGPVLGATLYNLIAVDCATARRVYLAYRGGSTPSGWGCDASRRICGRSGGFSIDEITQFSWRF